jgi:serine/threonine protein kinase
MLDSNLPEYPSKSDRAWLVMPVATPIDKALEGRPLQDVVGAVAAIAETLARLEHDHGVGHRDIKPGNLYEYEGDWLIGDFGLISLPGAESLTGDGRQVGPAHFTAYEMILNPSTADPHPADVYSLGKTLWVLATGQRFAPEGNQPANVRGLGVGDWTPHRHAQELDREIELMTQVRPEDRPTKVQVARDLTSWQELSAEEPVLDLSGAGARMRAKIGKVIEAQDTEQRYKELAADAARRLQELVTPINQELKREFPRSQTDLTNDQLTQNTMRVHLPGGSRTWVWRRCTLVSPLDGPNALQLRMSRVLELFGDTLYMHLLVLVSPAASMGSAFSWQPNGFRCAPVGSVEAVKMLEDGVGEMTEALRQAVEVLVERLPDEGAAG